MVIPLHDDNPTTTAALRHRRHPHRLRAGVRLAAPAAVGSRRERCDARLRLVPAVLTGREVLPPGIAVIPAWATVLTSMFMHGGFWHLAGNMLYLWIFGNNIEEAMGHARFFIFYVAVRNRGGVLAGTAQSRIGHSDRRRERRDLGRARRLPAAVSARARVVRVAAGLRQSWSSDDSRLSGCWRHGSACNS